MTRLTILLLTLWTCAHGQDSLLVKEACKKINELKNPQDVLEQNTIVVEQMTRQASTIANTPKEERVKKIYTLQYKLYRELKRTCPAFQLNQFPILQRVIDFEDKLTRPEIDSLTDVCVELSQSKNIYVYIVTIDNYFPDTNITDFSNRNREYWGQRGSYEKGNILISISIDNRQLRISTSDVSMKYLSDEKCGEINKAIIPYFKEGKYFNGLIRGLSEIRKSL